MIKKIEKNTATVLGTFKKIIGERITNKNHASALASINKRKIEYMKEITTTFEPFTRRLIRSSRAVLHKSFSHRNKGSSVYMPSCSFWERLSGYWEIILLT